MRLAIFSAARLAQSTWSGSSTGTFHAAMMPSPMYWMTTPFSSKMASVIADITLRSSPW